MKIPSKRKVQAQRKFAQGAYIPQNNATPRPTRWEAHPTPPAQDDKNVIHFKLSAKNLLDLVSLKKVHNHNNKTPVVVLERLEQKREVIFSTKENITNGTNGNHESEPPSPQPKSQINQIPTPKSPNRPKKTSMSLRPKFKKHIENKAIRKIVRRAGKIKKSTLQQTKNPLKRTSAASDADDEKPLQYFKKRKPLPDAEGTPGVSAKETATQPKEADNAQTFKDPAIPTRSRRSAPTQNDTGNTNQAEGTPGVSAKETATQPKEADNARTFKEPAIPTRTRRSAPAQNDTGNTSQDKPVNGTAAPTDGKVNQLYSSTGIERWLTEQTERVCSENVPAPDTETQRTENAGEATRRAVSPCPSENLRTVRDVMQAPPQVLLGRCQKCSNCYRVNVVEIIASLLKRQKRYQKNNCQNSDVYEFSDLDDYADPPSAYFPRRRSSQQRASSSDEDEQHCYLDLRDDSKHIIQLTSIKKPNSKKLIMKGRLVNKSDAQKADDFSLVEHENLLGQLLESVEENINGDEDDLSAPGPSKRPVPTTSGMNHKQKDKGMTTRARNEETQREPKPSTSKAKVPKEPEGKLLDAPVYTLTEEDFTDPIAFYEKVAPVAAKYGICKVIPPKSFKPRCEINDDLKFSVMNHYIARMYSRWGPSAREMSAIKAYLASHNVSFHRVPLREGLEVNLAKLYATVQRNGGLKEVMDKERWVRVAEEMGFENTDKNLDSYYLKYLLPYDTATKQEREEVVAAVERIWERKYNKLLAWSRDPLRHQMKLTGDAESSEEEEQTEDRAHLQAMTEAEDCIVSGRRMKLDKFKKIAEQAIKLYLGKEVATPEQVEEAYWKLVVLGLEHVCVNAASIDTSVGGYGFSKDEQEPTHDHPWNLKVATPEQVEEVYWKLVVLGLEHVCVNAASIDTSVGGYGFSKDEQEPTHDHPWNLKDKSTFVSMRHLLTLAFGGYGFFKDEDEPTHDHPWNLKNFRNNRGNVLSSLGDVLGVTLPTLHLAMVFSTYCWHRDPHGLPFIEYLHEGAPKIWYGIPEEQSTNFRNAVDALCPTSCQNKEIWLSSDITMIPPNLLREHKVTLAKTVQLPGEYIVVFPKCFSSSVAAGYSVSESLYFATKGWLAHVLTEFRKLRRSHEPTTFSLEHFLLNLAQDDRVSRGVLQQVLSVLSTVVSEELDDRRALLNMGIKQQRSTRAGASRHNAGPSRDDEPTECAVCRSKLFLSKVTGLLGKKKDVCLYDAIRILQKKAHTPDELQNIKLTFFKTELALDKIMKTLRKKILK